MNLPRAQIQDLFIEIQMLVSNAQKVRIDELQEPGAQIAVFPPRDQAVTET